MKKQLIAWTLVLSLLGSAMPALPAAAKEAAPAAVPPALAALEAQLKDRPTQAPKEVTFIVALNEEAILKAAGHEPYSIAQKKSAGGAFLQHGAAEFCRDRFRAALAKRGLPHTFHESYDMAIVGLSMKGTVSEAKAIAAMPEVQSVELNTLFLKPTLEMPRTFTPYDSSSHKMIDVGKVWEKSNRGEGSLIAIIDSGFDDRSTAFAPLDAATAKIPNAQALQELKDTKHINDGKFFSTKIPFGYNYAGGRPHAIKENSPYSHGMHVAGIIGANTEALQGVAPAAQLAIMRVFSDAGAGTGPEIYIKAIDDAVKLGADSINMSLGSPAGSETNFSAATQEALDGAEAMGVPVAIAVGNDGFFGHGATEKPNVNNPDLGLISDPAIARTSIGVASVENLRMAVKGLRIKGEDRTLSFAQGDNGMKLPQEAVHLLDCGYGYKDEFPKKKPASGTFALIQRGNRPDAEPFNFTDKIANADAAGFAGVVIYDNEPDQPLIAMVIKGTAIPAVFINNADGLYLKEHNGDEILFDQSYVFADNPKAGQVSDFSTWGMTAEGHMKPDLAAPGGNIWSTLNDGEFGNMSGTSMATPHVAGAIPLVKKRIRDDFPELYKEDLQYDSVSRKTVDRNGPARSRLIKNLLMSSAVPVKDASTNAYTTPRQQGAGVLNVAAAIATPAIFEGTDGIASVNLGGDLTGETVTVPFKLRNLSDKPLSYRIHGVLNSDMVEEDHYVMKPRFLAQSEPITVKLAAKETKDLTVTLTLPPDLDLAKQMPRGFFLEGFIFAEAEELPTISLPYIGFHGHYDERPTIEPTIYDLTAQGQRPYYMERANAQFFPFTHLNAYVDGKPKVLGQLGDAYKTDWIAFSPNGDGNADDFHFYGTFFRHYHGFGMTIREYQGDGKLGGKLVKDLRAHSDKGMKNFYAANYGSGLLAGNLVTTKGHWAWDGTDEDNNQVPEGRYMVVVEATPDGSTKQQKMGIPVTIDRTRPRVTDAGFENDGKTYVIRKVEERGAGIAEMVIRQDGSERKPDGEGRFDVSGLDPKKAKVVIRDHAYNITEYPLEKGTRTGKERSLEVRGITTSGAVPQSAMRYTVQTPDGRIEDPTNLPIGEHILVFGDIDPAYDFLDPADKQIPFEITEADQVKTIEVKFSLAKTQEILISVTGNGDKYPISFVLVDQKTHRVFRPKDPNADRRVFRVPAGTYKVDITGLDDKAFAVVKYPSDDASNGEQIVITEQNFNKLMSIDVRERKTVQQTFRIDRQGYAGAFALILHGKDYGQEKQMVQFAAGETEKTVDLTNIPSTLALTGMEDGHYRLKGTGPVSHGFTPSTQPVQLTFVHSEHIVPGYVDRTELRALVQKAREIREHLDSDYVYNESHWQYFKLILSGAEIWLEKPEATQPEIDQIAKNLKDGMDRLRKKGEVDKQDLLLYLKDAADLDAADFETAPWAALEKAVQAGEKAQNGTDQEAIDRATDALKDAMRDLHRKDGAPIRDFTAIDALLAQVKGLDDLKYTPDQWKPVEIAVAAARLVKDRPAPNRADMNRAEDDLRTALAALGVSVEVPDTRLAEAKKALAKAIEGAEKLREADYSEASWQPFAEALAAAKTALADPKADHAALLKARSALKNAQNALQKRKPDSDPNLEAAKATLRQSIEAAEGLKEIDYSAKTWSAFAKALADAKTALADPKADLDRLLNAQLQLELTKAQLKPAEDPAVAKARAALAEAVEAAEELKSADYSEASWAPFAAALKEARTVLDQDDATADALQAAAQALATAQKALQPAKTDDSALRTARLELLLAIKEGERLKAEDYSPASWRDFESALQAAKACYEAKDATLASLQKAAADLARTKEALVPPVDEELVQARNALAEAIEAAKALDPALYTEAGQKALAEAIAAAEAVWSNASADRAALETAKSDLATALEALEKRDENEATPGAIFLLELGVNAAEAVDLTKVEGAPALLTEALTQAKHLLEEEHPDREDVDKATMHLQSTLQSLTYKAGYTFPYKTTASWVELGLAPYLEGKEGTPDVQAAFLAAAELLDDKDHLQQASQELLERWAKEKEEADAKAALQKAADALTAALAKLPAPKDVTAKDRPLIEGLRARIDAASPEVLALVEAEALARLDACEKALTDLAKPDDRHERPHRGRGHTGSASSGPRTPAPAVKPEPKPDAKVAPQTAEKPAAKTPQIRISGYSDGSFRPDQALTRAELAALIAAFLPEATSAAPFHDVASDAWYANALARLADAGLMNGYSDGSFRPNAPIRRAEMAAVLAGWKTPAAGQAAFADVASGHWAGQAIAKVAHAGWMRGRDAHHFAPNAPLTRAEAVVILTRVQGAPQKAASGRTFTDVPESHWAYQAIMNATAPIGQ